MYNCISRGYIVKYKPKNRLCVRLQFMNFYFDKNCIQPTDTFTISICDKEGRKTIIGMT